MRWRRESPGLRLLMLVLLGVVAASLPAASSSADTVFGEQHEVDFSAHNAFLLTQDALRGKGVLFDVKPGNSLATLWTPTNTPVGFLAALLGEQARYRYEIQVVPEGSHKSKIVVNLRGQHIAQDALGQYKASTRLGLFNAIDQLAARYPPPSGRPREGGVNFALLPNEDLRGLAKRVTGDESNWREIAKDNGISSPTDVTPFQTIWVSNSLLKKPKPGS